MIINPAAMALFLPLLFVLLLATGGQANADELSTSHHALSMPAPAPAPKGYEISRGSMEGTGGHREINIGPCFLSKGGNALSAPSCIKRCMSKGYAGGRCDTVSGGFPGDCFCLTLEFSTSQRAVPEPASAPKGYEPSSGPLEATGGQHQREINIGPCFSSKGSNALSDNRGNAPSCITRCTSKGFAGGRCDTVSGGFPRDCFCLTLELSTSQRAVPEAAPAPKGYETSRGPLEATEGQHQREFNIGPCFPSKGSNALSDNTDNASSCIKRCTSKGYTGGRCNTVSGGFPGDCFCLTG